MQFREIIFRRTNTQKLGPNVMSIPEMKRLKAPIRTEVVFPIL